uniref:Ionotropic glutamate receptor C-terminal domain-containing protein n=1 Tax=Anopheles dirus TaxID=7168 RepID=A0A182N1F5_9DIPT
MPAVVVVLWWSRRLVPLLLVVYVTGDGVDLIARSAPAGVDPVRERFAALERRFLERDDPRCARHGPQIVLLQFEGGDDSVLSHALRAFTDSSESRPRVVYRVAGAGMSQVADLLASIKTATGTGEDSASCLVLLLLLPNLTLQTAQLLTLATARTYPLALKMFLISGAPSSGCPTLEVLADARTLLATLWRTERALRTVTAWCDCPINSRTPAALLYDPFVPDPATNTPGAFHTLTDLNQPSAPSARSTPNLHRTPVDIYGFEAAMAYRRHDIDMMPRTFPAHGAPADGSLLDALFGADVEAVRMLAERLNFTPRVHYVRANFGFKMANGTFTGVLGRLTSRDSWLSMNVYFLKDYETRDLQFSAGIPDWMLIFRCFTPTLWIVVWCTVVLVSLCYVALTRCVAHTATGRQETLAPPPDVGALVGQIVGALLTAPTDGISRTTGHQKLFVAFGLIWGLTITGAFQGSLVDVYTTPTSMRNLDTLPELDASGLTITVNAPALIVDVFGTERPGTTLGNLKQRLVIEENPVHPAALAVLAGHTAGLIRNQDFVRLSTKYLAADGTARLHRLRQCPRSYTLAYLYPRGSPLYRAANGLVLRLLQHGLYAKWERDAAHILAMNRALKVHRYGARSGRGATAAAGQVTLRLDHLLLPFMLLGSGMALGACCLLCELRSRRRGAM